MRQQLGIARALVSRPTGGYLDGRTPPDLQTSGSGSRQCARSRASMARPSSPAHLLAEVEEAHPILILNRGVVEARWRRSHGVRRRRTAPGSDRPDQAGAPPSCSDPSQRPAGGSWTTGQGCRGHVRCSGGAAVNEALVRATAPGLPIVSFELEARLTRGLA
jgi:hypothetical protein